MKYSNEQIKLILGLKLKQLRAEKNLSFADLSKKSGLSVSYLNEIESGKKYPKAEKLSSLSEALGITYDQLVSLKLTKNLAPLEELLRSNLLKQLPLDHYGIDINKLISLIANASAPLNALVTTLIEMARSSELSKNNFSRTALRLYKEFNDNYFDDLEKEAEKTRKKFKLPVKNALNFKLLSAILTNNFNYIVDEKSLNETPDLTNLRAVVLQKKNPTLMLNRQLSDAQKSFVAGKELAYNILKVKDRSFIHSNIALETFDHLLNNFRASYFSNALILGRKEFVQSLSSFFRLKKFDGNGLIKLIEKYNATPEMFFQRMTNLLPKYLGMNKFFFLRFNTSAGNNNFHLSKEMRLNISRNPGGYQTSEHHCQRWISIRILKELSALLKKNSKYEKKIVRTLNSEVAATGEHYLNISAAKVRRLIKGDIYSVTIGFLMDENTKNKIRFWNDPEIDRSLVNNTCEMCDIPDCKERAASPTSIEKIRTLDKLKNSIQILSVN